MIFLFGERIRARANPIGDKRCALCETETPFTEQMESLWFTCFGLPLLKIEDKACFWRCEKCLSAYRRGHLDKPSQVNLTKQIIAYLLLGYSQNNHHLEAQEICMKITGFDFPEDEYRSLIVALGSGQQDMVETLRQASPELNAIGKQQIIEAAFLTTYICCDLQYEDRLRINLMGNAMDVGLEFVEYAIRQTRKTNYYGVRRLAKAEAAI